MPSFWDAFTKPEPAPAPPAPASVTALDDARTSRYAARALADECERVASAPEGTRNDTLNRAAFNLAQFLPGGHLAQDELVANLTAAARVVGLEAREIELTITSGLRAGAQHPRAIPEQRPLAPDLPAWLPPPSEPSVGPGGGGEVTPEEAREQRRQQMVALELEQQRIRRDAKRLLDAEEAAAGFRVPPYRDTLTDELAIPDEPVTYTVADLLPTGGNVLLTAQFKTGKTTLINNLARALADRTPFLGRFDVADINGRVALWNYEVDDRMYRRWLREMNINNTDRVSVLNLRGYRMPVTVAHVEDWIVDWLRAHEVALWVVDPFARAFTGSGKSENDNTEVGAFLDALDVIKARAGVSDLVLPTHTGRAEFEQGEERARGATRLDDWADIRWFLTKDEAETRYFRATGRDVDVSEEKLTFDEGSRALTIGGGDRAWEQRRRLEELVVEVVLASPGINLSGLREAVRAAGGKGRNDVIDSAISGAEKGHRIWVERGRTGSATRHFPPGHVAFGGAA